MSDTAFFAALDQLGTLLEKTGGNLAMASARMAQESNIDELTKLGDRLAAVRWIDAALYDALFAGQPAAPPFASLTENPRPWFMPDGLVAQGDGRYGWASEAALQRDQAWKDCDPGAHASWHGELAGHFEQGGSEVPSLDLLHHANLGNRPDVVYLFEQAFAAADRDFDVPRLNSILETIRLRPPPRETPLLSALGQAETYFAGRTLFRRDFQLTTRFFERDAALESFFGTIEGKPAWIWHMHASGGVGKTTFLRWLIARVLLPRPGRAICARIDFDDYRLDVLVNYPMRAIAEILRQIDLQRPSSDLQLIIRNLDDASREAGWHDGLLQSVATQLALVRIDMPVVVVLDTLEDATRTQAAWLGQLVDVIARLRAIMPALTLVLSGRYDVSEIVPSWLTSQMVVHELSRFNHDEANAYLEKVECIASPAIRDAVLDRVCAEDAAQAPSDRRFNPFKLYLLGEIVRGDPKIDVDRIRAIESVDLAYLIERVILRIEHQALRWLIRYAVVARELDLQFLDQVLLPELRDALTGKTRFDLVAHDDIGVYRGQDIWRPDRIAAESLDAHRLLEDLRGYATDRGWISVDTGSAIVRLHPEVIEPTRKLLAGQKVFRRLHRRALKLAQNLASVAKTPGDWVSAKSMEIFHEYQRSPDGGTKAWRNAIVQARQFGRPAVEGIAKEILGKDYESCPLALHAEANLIIARVLIEQAVSEASENVELLTRIVNHLETAWAQDENGVDPAFRDLASRLSMARSAPAQLLVAFGSSEGAGALALVYSDLALAWRLSVLRSSEPRKLAHEFVARARRRRAAKFTLTIGDAHLALWQSAIARSLSDTKSAKDALASVRIDRNSSTELEYSILLAKAANALLDYDLAEAQAQLVASKLLAKLDQNGVQAGWSIILRMDYALAAHDPFAALQVAAEATGTLTAGDKMEILCRSAFAAAIACEFDRAEDYFREAEALIEATDNAASSGLLWERLKWRMRAALLGMRHPNLAEKLLSGGIGSGRGRLDQDHEAEIAAFRVWIELLRGKEQAAGAHLPPPGVLASAPPGIAWALSLATIGLADPSRNAELAAILDGPLPAGSDFYLALKYAAERRTRIPLGLIDAGSLVSRMPRIEWLSPGAEMERVGQADLLYLLGRDDLAKKRIGDPFSGLMSEANLLVAIEYERCRQRHGLDADFYRPWRYAERKHRLKGSARGLAALAAVLLGQEWVSAGDWAEGSDRALEGRHHFWEQREPSGWSQRIWEVAALADLQADRGRGSLYLENARVQQVEVGLAPLARLTPLAGSPSASGTSGPADRTDWVHRELLGLVAQEQFDIEAPAWDRSAIGSWVREWLRDPDTMRDRLTEIAWFAPVPPGSRVQIDIERKLVGSLASALPWELATALDGATIVRRTIGRSTGRRSGAEPRVSTGATVLIGRPAEPASFAAIPSLTNEVRDAYRRSAPGDRFFQFDALRSDIFAELPKLANEAVEIVHIVAVMQEAKGGYALDFRSNWRDYSEGQGGQQQVAARHLQSLLGSLRSRPLVILDIEATDNDAATAEMLVQRNAFAEEFYDPSFMVGLIATGLAPYEQRQAAELLLIEALTRGATVGEAYSAIRVAPVPPGGRTADLYWPRASALWCDDTEVLVRAGKQQA